MLVPLLLATQSKLQPLILEMVRMEGMLPQLEPPAMCQTSRFRAGTYGTYSHGRRGAKAGLNLEE
jgi:hypothetical protein